MKEHTDIRRLRKVLRLQGNPLDLAHPDRVRKLLQPFDPEQLRRCPAAWARLGKVAEKAWGLKPCDWKPDNSILTEILLATDDQTTRAEQWLGTLAAYGNLQKTIRGDLVRNLHEKLPHCFPAVYRQITGFKAWLQSLSPYWTMRRELMPEDIEACGHHILADAIGRSMPPQIMRRWSLQFPQGTEPTQNEQDVPPCEDCQGLLTELQNRGLILC